MKLTLSHNDKSWLSFDLKDLMWLALVIGVWATLDYRTKYTDNVLKWNEELRQKIGEQNGQLAQLKEQNDFLINPYLGQARSMEEQVLSSFKEYIGRYNSSGAFQKRWIRHELENYLNELNYNRSFLIKQLDTLKPPTDEEYEEERKRYEQMENKRAEGGDVR